MITVVIPSFNEQANLARLLPQLRTVPVFLVLDDNNTDGSAELAGSFSNVTVVRHRYEGYGQQINWALDALTTPWCCVLDADEEFIEPHALELLRELVSAADTGQDAFAFRRRNLFAGRELRGGIYWPDWQTRLFRSSLRYEDRSVHPHIAVSRERIRLAHAPTVRHYAFESAEHYLRKMLYYAERESRTDAVSSESHRPRYRRLKALYDRLPAKPIVRFVYEFLFRQGYRDGYAGFYLALWSAVKVSMSRGLRLLRSKEEKR